MGLLDRLFRRKALQTDTRYQVVNGQLISPVDNKTAYITDGYTVNDIIYSIVNIISDKVRVAPWATYKVVDESSLKKYKAILNKKDLKGEDFMEALRLKEGALEEINDSKLDALLDSPDGCGTFQDLVANSSIMKLLTGDRMIWAELLDGGANTGKPQSLHILPTNLVTILVGMKWPFSINGYKIEQWGVTNDKAFRKEAVLHDKYFNPNYDSSGSHLYGLSPLKAALILTTKSNEANKTEAAQFQNQGPKKVLFTDVDPDKMDVGTAGQQANAIKAILQGKEYSGGSNAGKVATSGYKMGVVDVGLSPVELGIIESEKWSLRRFCNVYGVPSQLLNDPDNKTFNNQKEGEKALTMRCALPQLNSFREHFNRKLKTDWGYKGQNIIVDYDISVYSELQEDLGEKWKWARELPVSWGYKLELMGMDQEDEGPGLDEVMIPSGFQPIDAYSVVNDGQQETNDTNA